VSTTVRISHRIGNGPALRDERQAPWAEGGLAVTRAVGGPDWAVTHTASGYALFQRFRTQAAARKAARRALAIGDWTVSRTELGKNRQLVAAAKALRATLKAEGVLS